MRHAGEQPVPVYCKRSPTALTITFLGTSASTSHVARFREKGLLRNNTEILVTHISHDGDPPHPEPSACAEAKGYEIAYDGMTVQPVARGCPKDTPGGSRTGLLCDRQKKLGLYRPSIIGGSHFAMDKNENRPKRRQISTFSCGATFRRFAQYRMRIARK